MQKDGWFIHYESIEIWTEETGYKLLLGASSKCQQGLPFVLLDIGYVFSDQAFI